MVTVLRIAGMRSVHCARAVRTALAGVPGIGSAEVRIGHAVIDHDDRTTAEAIRAAVAQAGYEVTSARHERRLPLRDD